MEVSVLVKRRDGSGRKGHGEAQQHGNEIWVYPKFDALPGRSSQIHVLLHELGHWYRDQAVPLGDIMGWEPGEGFYGVYGMPNSEEGFAEAFATYFTDPNHLWRNWPDAFKKIKAYVKGSGMDRKFLRFADEAVDKLRSERPQRESAATRPKGILIETATGSPGFYFLHPDDEAKRHKRPLVRGRYYGPLRDEYLVAALTFHSGGEQMNDKDRVFMARYESLLTQRDIDYMEDVPNETGWKSVKFMPLTRLTRLPKGANAPNKKTFMRWVLETANDWRRRGD